MSVTHSSLLRTADETAIGGRKSWVTPDLALEDDATPALALEEVVPAGFLTQRLQVFELVDKPSRRLQGLEEVRFYAKRGKVQHGGGPFVDEVIDQEAYLIVDGAELTAINKAENPANVWPVPPAEESYIWTAANLATLGVTDAHPQGLFGFSLSANKADTVDQTDALLESVRVELQYAGYDDSQGGDELDGASEGEDDMDKQRLAKNGGEITMLSEAIADLTDGTAEILANAPLGTRLVKITPFAQDVLIRTDGEECVAAEGHQYAWGQTYVFAWTKSQCEKVRALEAAATGSLFVSYLA